jgi:hypothetical protein
MTDTPYHSRLPLQSQALLERWPEKYRGGGFRLDGEDILIFKKGQPTLRLSAAVNSSASPDSPGDKPRDA